MNSDVSIYKDEERMTGYLGCSGSDGQSLRWSKCQMADGVALALEPHHQCVC